MKRLFAKLIMNTAGRWFEESVPARELQGFLARCLEQLTQRTDLSPEARADLLAAWRAANAVDLIPNNHPLELETDPWKVNLDTARAWRASLPEDKVVIKGVVPRALGRSLAALEAANDPDTADFTARAVESLLRHVEVKRRAALTLFSPPLNPDEARLERCDLAIYLCLRARRCGDLRLLNTALKLNDWAYPAFRGRAKPDAQARYLRALAEQERAVKELLG